MNENSLKRNQVVSAEDHHNDTDEKKIQLGINHRGNSKEVNFVKFCKNACTNSFKDNRLSLPGYSLFSSLFSVIILCIFQH